MASCQFCVLTADTSPSCCHSIDFFMETEIQLTSSWNFLNREVLWSVLRIIFQSGEMRQQALSFALVNKHWCDAVRGYATMLRPRTDRLFSLTRDLKTVCRYDNLEVLIAEDRDAEDAPATEDDALQTLRWLKRVKVTNPELNSVRSLLECTTAITHLSLLDPRFPVADICEALNDCKALKWLQLTGTLDALSQSRFSLCLPRLERLDVRHLQCSADGFAQTVGCCIRLKMLRVDVVNFSALDFETMHGLKHLKSLVLDGTLRNDLFDPSSFPHLRHLSFSCRRLPSGFKDVSTLTSLGLETWDRMQDESLLQRLYSIVRHLKDLDLHLPAAARSTVSDLLSYGIHLKKLKIRNHKLLAVDVYWLKRLEELDISFTVYIRRSKRRDLLQGMALFRNLKTLIIDFNAPIDLCHLFYEEIDPPIMQLRKLVARNLVLNGIPSIFCSGQVLRELHLSNFIFEASMFRDIWYRYLRRLQLLSFSQCRWKRSMKEELEEIAEWKVLRQLHHLALPSECFAPESMYLVDAIKEMASETKVDDRPDWSPIDFRM